jgi:hypothetical protein
MSAAASNTSAEGVKALYNEGVKALYNEVIATLIGASIVEAPHNSVPYFNPVVKSEVPNSFMMNNKQKYKYVPYNSS